MFYVSTDGTIIRKWSGPLVYVFSVLFFSQRMGTAIEKALLGMPGERMSESRLKALSRSKGLDVVHARQIENSHTV